MAGRSRRASSRSRREAGTAAERRVRRHFRLRGYRIVAANVWVGGYELDLVVRRGGRVVVCEVKAKTDGEYGHPLEMVTEEKARRIRLAAEAWLASRPELAGVEVALEAAAVQGRRVERAPFD